MSPRNAPERIPVLENDVQNLRREVNELRERIAEGEKKQDTRHTDNTHVLQRIQLTLQELSGARDIGKYVMNLMWGLAGTAVGALIAKWISKI